MNIGAAGTGAGPTWAAEELAANSRGIRSQRITRIILHPRSLKSGERQTTVADMERPIEVDLPHSLGKDEARRRIANNVHKLREHIPGGAAHVESSWAGDALNLDIHALGQAVQAEITVQERLVRCRVMLPGMLALCAAPIEATLNAKGRDLLLEDHTKD
jgi:hypothetical protein